MSTTSKPLTADDKQPTEDLSDRDKDRWESHAQGGDKDRWESRAADRDKDRWEDR